MRLDGCGDSGQGVGEGNPDLSAVASLEEPTRRRIFDHLGAQNLPASRDDVAEVLGISRRTAAFHLDRLAEMGLLTVSFARRTGRNGPGAGRTAKLYQRSAREVSVSLPPRHYDLAGRLLAGALAQVERSGEPPGEVLGRRARELGQSIARARTAESGLEDPDDSDVLMGLLHDNGYEPHLADRDIFLQNCPFHALAQEETELVCGMNLQLLTGVLDGLGGTGLLARLDPGPSRCCVRIERSEQMIAERMIAEQT